MTIRERVGEIWDERLLPRVVELTCSDRLTAKWREQVCAPATGEVLEVGFGSGTNLAHYPAAVEKVYVVEPSDLAWRRAASAVEEFDRPVERIGLDGAVVGLPDASVDTVITSYAMCTIPDLDAALAEMHRVLRPDGRLHFVEHGLSPDPDVARRQRRWQPWWGKIAGGCHLDRDIPSLVGQAGFTYDDLGTFYAPGPRFSRPFNWLNIGHARPSQG